MNDDLFKRIQELNKVNEHFNKYNIVFKNYDTGRETFQGQEVEFLWLDEEPPEQMTQEEVDKIFEIEFLKREMEEELKKSETKTKRIKI